MADAFRSIGSAMATTTVTMAPTRTRRGVLQCNAAAISSGEIGEPEEPLWTVWELNHADLQVRQRSSVHFAAKPLRWTE